jgi:hypothetical protein
VKRDARIWIALGVILFLGFLLTLGRTAEPDRDEPETVPLRSTYRSRPSGLRGLYLTLERLGYRPRRHVESLTSLEGAGALVIAEPVQELEQEEWTALARWVEKGNLLLLLSDSGRLFEPKRPRAYPPALPATASPLQPAPVTVGAPGPVVQSTYRLKMTGWKAGGGAGPPLIPLYADGQGPVVSMARWGKGWVLLSCSPWSISNEGIAQGSNLALFLNVIDVYGAGKGQPIYFDEYHQGHARGGGALGLLAPVARFGVAQLVFALLLLVFAVAWRFGGAIPLGLGERRSRAEYLGAMTSLVRRAGALELVAGKLGEETRRDLARGLGLPPTAPPEEIAAAAHAKRGVDAAHVREVLTDADLLSVARDRQIPIDERRVHAAALRLHDLREELLGRRS